MTERDLPHDEPMTMGQKAAISELAAVLTIWAWGNTGEPGRPMPHGGSKAKQFHARKDGEYLALLIENAAKAGLGHNVNAHALFAHELDYFSGRGRTVPLEGDPPHPARDPLPGLDGPQ